MNNHNKSLLPNSSPKKKKSCSQPVALEISPEVKKNLETVWKSKKSELAQLEERNLKPNSRYRYKKQSAGQQLGFYGLKGKKSLNPRNKQLNKPGEIQSQVLNAQNICPGDRFSQKTKEYQLSLNIDLKQENRAIRRAIERNTKKLWKKEPGVCWTPRREVEEMIYRLKTKYNEDGKRIFLKTRSREVWTWLHSLKPNKFKTGHIPIPIAEFKIFLKGYNRNQCTELFIAFLSMCLNQKSKSKYISGGQPNFISHFGFNNSYSEMNWKERKKNFMQEIISRLNALNWVDLKEIKIKIHKTKKVFYELVFNSLNKWSKEPTDKQKKKALEVVNNLYFERGLDPPRPVFLLGLNWWPKKF